MSAFLQTLSGDLDITTTPGQLTVSRDLAVNTAMKLTNLFEFALGEWFRDLRQGVPYIQYVFVKNPSLPLITTIFERVLKSPPGVGAITKLNLNFQPRERTLGTDFAVQTNDGAIITGGVGQPFIISVKQGVATTP